MDNLNRCKLCSKKLLSHSSVLKCSACHHSFHINCLSISKTDSIFVNRLSDSWICVKCIDDCLPFNHLDDDDFYECSVLCYSHKIGRSMFDLNSSESGLVRVDNSDEGFDPLGDLDPDEHFYRFLPGIFNQSSYFDEDSFNSKLNELGISRKNLGIIHFNARSAPKNLTHIECFLDCLDFSFPFVCTSETWFDESNADLYNIKGYRQENNYRSSRRGGGVSIFIKEGIEYKLRPDLAIFNVDIESIFIEVDGSYVNSSKSQIIGCIYRPPNRDINVFRGHMKDIRHKLRHYKKRCHLLGDYNINLLRAEQHPETSDFLDDMYSDLFMPAITKPTRITDKSATLIDNIFTDNVDADSFQGILYTGITDHLPVFLIFKDVKVDSLPKVDYIYKRSFSQENILKFHNAINSVDWANSVCSISDPHESFTKFHTKYTSLYNTFFPLKKVKIGYATKKPWLTSGVKNSIKTKNKMYIRLLKHPSASNEQIYHKYKNRLNYIIRKLEREYIAKLLAKHKSNLKKTWKVMKDIINRNKKANSPPEYFDYNGEHITDKEKIANSFNDFYVNVGPNLCKSLPKHTVSPMSYLKDRNSSSMFVEPTDQTEITEIVMSLKDSAVGWDGLSAKILKQSISFVKLPLAHVFNRSLACGVVPNELKLAKVLPLFKADSKVIFSNYRPVSVLPVMSKILEKLMYKRLLAFLNKHNILYKLQFGFRSGHSTAMALMCLVDNIAKSIDNGEYTLGVFLDFSKAFDCLNHKILFDKLDFYGVRGEALQWFKSYFSERNQYVVYNGYESVHMPITCGVPQGSILGPLLFLLYVNDVINVSSVLLLLLYADDTNAFLSGNDLDLMIDIMNKELEKLVIWLQVNKLKLNVKKTHFMIFSSGKRKYEYSKKLYICDAEIKVVKFTKFLGVIIDQNLNWKHHILHVKKKLAKGIGIICKARKYLNYPALRTLYHSFFYPYIDYCIEVWGSAGKTIIEKLCRIQRKAVRLITKSNYRADTKPLFENCKIFTIAETHILKISLFMYRVHHKIAPTPLTELFIRNSEIHSHNTRSQNNFRVPNFKLDVLKYSPRVIGVYVWNFVNQNVDCVCSLTSYRLSLRQFILGNEDITDIIP